MSKGQIPVWFIAGVGFVFSLGASVVAATWRVSVIDTKVEVVSTTEKLHNDEVVKRLDILTETLNKQGNDITDIKVWLGVKSKIRTDTLDTTAKQ